MAIEQKVPQKTPPKQLDNRTFGLIFSAIFLVITLFPLVRGSSINLWSAYVCAAFALPALISPKLLTPLNWLFQKFGLVMHKITNPLLMGLVFFVTVLPTGLIMRLLGKDPMNRKLDPTASTYWITREDGKLSKESFDNQF